MKSRAFRISGLVSLSLLAGCATTPMAPTVEVDAGPNKSFDVYQQDQVTCKAIAQSDVQGEATAANQGAIGATLAGAGLGAGLGAAWGGNHAAGVGAANGAIAGSAYGAANSASAQSSIQQQYDVAYEQCMIAKGNVAPPPPPAPEQASSSLSPVAQGLVGGWDFGRISQGPLAPGGIPCHFTLSADPGPFGWIILNHCVNNESYWQMRGNQLVFIDENGQTSSVLNEINPNYWVGPYVAVPSWGVVHFIRR